MNETNDIDSFIREWKDLLTGVLTKVREQSKTTQNPIAQARFNAKWELIDLLMLFLNKKETDMQKLKSELIKQVISLDDLEPIRKHSELEEKIKEAVDVLAPNQAGLVDAGAIKWGHFSAKVSQMRIDEKIPGDITSSRRGENFYLVRLPKGQTVQPRKRRETAGR